MQRAQRSRDEWIALLEAVNPANKIFDPPAGLYDAGHELIARAMRLDVLRDGDRIVEIGSGVGRLVIPLTRLDVRYDGVEPIRASVELCQQLFAPWPHVRFQHAPLYNTEYAPDGTIDPAQWRFPFADGEADLVIFSSVHTHLERLVVSRRYLSEAWRILRPGGRCWTSWFRSPPNEPSASAGRTVFREVDILNLLRPFEFFYSEGGLTTGYHDQWGVVVRKPAAAAGPYPG